MRNRRPGNEKTDQEIRRDDPRELASDRGDRIRDEEPLTRPTASVGGREMQHVTEAREPVMPRVETGTGETLFGETDTRGYRARWESIQASFVDEPRRAVEEADALVRDLTGRIADVFTRQRSSLEQQWDRGGDVSTEDLRVALQRYRDYFNRLLTL